MGFRNYALSGYFLFGRDQGDMGLMIDFHKMRAIVRANTAWINGVPLEEIPPGVSGYHPGMVLVHRNWRDIYFLDERAGWTDQQYFTRAQEVMRKKGITKP